MKRLHFAIGVKNINESIQDYQKRFNCKPAVVIENEYALFRTESLNVSIRKVDDTKVGLRHLGWEDEACNSFTEENDCNGLTWENFRKEDQIKEILEVWPDSLNSNSYLNKIENNYSHLPVLETERLILRPLQEKDIQEVYDNWASDPKVAKYTSWKAHQSINETAQFVNQVVSNYEDGLMDTWGIVSKSDSRLIGSGGYTPDSKKGGVCNIGYALSRPYWNQGLMTEAVKKMVEFGFSTLMPSRLQSYVYVEHEASQKVLKKVGFQFEGILRNYCLHHGKPTDVNMFSVQPSDLNK
jgi:[ribosomal protein S5]-alanine N-acetyltransferase